MKLKFSERITALRKANGLSQKIAAKELGISQALLSHYENGIRECSLEFVVKLSRFYDVSCDYLLGISSGKNASADLHSEARALETVLEAADTMQDRTSASAIKKAAACSVFSILCSVLPEDHKINSDLRLCACVHAAADMHLACVQEKSDISDDTIQTVIKHAESAAKVFVK